MGAADGGLGERGGAEHGRGDDVAGHDQDDLLRATVVDGCRYWATDPVLARRVLGLTAADPEAAALVARHDDGRLALLRTVVGRLDEAGLLAVGRQEALDVLWLLTGFDAYDALARGRARSTSTVAALLVDLAHARLVVSAFL
ncbi:hypothetical protein [Actinomycetospora straminea]|uniref:TetR family transcriptional regulator n=1 Tax=Actinomycetospora straminea TaxID=663607 RepID=A0ABP9F066_9PSEU|nr:hypothetical protein [Actinomycetospora straminea]MDD7932873.1 hypothetical protein [Actinomycetospora straminea]